MKKQINQIFFYGVLFLIMAGLASCESYLDKEPSTDVDPEAAYKTFYNFQGFTEELYNCIPVFDKREYNNHWNFGEEEHYSNNGRGELGAGFDRGDFFMYCTHWNKTWLYGTTFDSNGDRWNHFLWQGCWYGIRKANMGIANLDKLVGTQEERDLIEGQLYFFRAWFHFQLIVWWGGMPYIDKVLPSNEKLTLPRESWLECAEKIAADFKKAAGLLPLDWDNTAAGKNTYGYNELRINKIMALGFLAKNYLYAGSPWMHNGSYNADYCKKAADTFGEILKMVENGGTRYALVDWEHYPELWHTNGQSGKMPGSTEAIFRGPAYDGPGGTAWSTDKQYLAANILQGRSWSLYPAANYANYFGMANGLPINDTNSSETAGAESGYNPQYPWKNRDPRFYLTYAFDTQRMILAPPSDKRQYEFANLYTYTPADAASTYRNPESGSTTGYLLIKFDPIGFNQYDNKYNNHHIHVSWLRLGDIYLMYSEAVANGYGSPSAGSSTYPNLTALDATDKIRDRVNVPHFASRYRGSTDAFMTELRRERAVELAWEGHRFHDLRRWRLLDKYPYNIKTKIEFDRAEPVNFDKNDPTNNKVLNLKETVIVERKYGEKHYWLPLMKDFTYLYPEFYQNPGW